MKISVYIFWHIYCTYIIQIETKILTVNILGWWWLGKAQTISPAITDLISLCWGTNGTKQDKLTALLSVCTVFTMYLDLIQPSFKNCNWIINSTFMVCTAVFTILQKSFVWDSPSVYDTICHDHKFIWTFVVFWNEVQLIHSLQIYVEQFIWNQPLLDLAVV